MGTITRLDNGRGGDERPHPAGKDNDANSAQEGRKAPYNLQAEKALLGAILLSNAALDRVSDFLEPHHFFDPLHQQIFETASKLIASGKQATPITLRTFFENAEPIDASLTVPQYLGRLAANAPTIINARDYGRTVHDLATRRDLILISEDIQNAAYDSPVDFPVDEQLLEARQRFDSAYSAAKGGDNPTWDEPNRELIEDRRGDLPEFPLHVLNDASRDWLMRAACGAGVTPAHVVVPFLTVASSLIGAARRVRPHKAWSEPFTVWTAIVGQSGTGKTPGLDVSRRALSAIDRARAPDIADLERRHDARVEAAKIQHRLWRERVAAAVAGNTEPPPRPAEADDIGKFAAPRLFVSDSTTERLLVLLQARPRGLLLMVDELAGLFGNMSRYNNGSDREFWLEAWVGGQYRQERQGRGSIAVEHLLVGITGGFQPDKLVRSFAGDNDGMTARFLFAWPSEPAYQPLADDIDEVDAAFREALERLIDLDARDGATELSLATDALEAFEQFREAVRSSVAALDGREREWHAKGPSQVLRLAGTLTYVAWAMPAAAQASPSEPTEINLEALKHAIALWKDFFWPHAQAALRLMGINDRYRNERTVLCWIRARQLQEVSLQNLRRDALSQRLYADETEALIERLSTACWLRPIPAAQTGRGRPRRRWEINPKLFP